MRFQPFAIITACLLCCLACKNNQQTEKTSLKDDLYALVDTVPGTVGIAFISNDDTVTINNGVNYPMMSVFKLHQALAVASAVEKHGDTLDTMLFIHREELDPHTWSPMLKKYTAGDFSITVGELLGYAITASDNNASNLLFKHIISPRETNDFIKSVARDTTFRICYSESEMKADHKLSCLNYTSPLSAGLLIRQVFEESLVGKSSQDSIMHHLSAVTTGQDRLGAAADDSVMFAHKTGSGYRNEAGELMAHNDVGYFRFKDGRSYSLAVFISNFRGSEEKASQVIAGISKCVYRHFKESTVR